MCAELARACYALLVAFALDHRGDLRAAAAVPVAVNERIGEGGECEPLPDGLSPHALRRTFALWLIAEGEDVSYVMDQMGEIDTAEDSGDRRAGRAYSAAVAGLDGDRDDAAHGPRDGHDRPLPSRSSAKATEPVPGRTGPNVAWW